MLKTEVLFKNVDSNNKFKPLTNHQKIKIASIQFGYANKYLINLLKNRGSKMREGNINRIKNIDQKINKMVEKNFKDL